MLGWLSIGPSAVTVAPWCVVVAEDAPPGVYNLRNKRREDGVGGAGRWASGQKELRAEKTLAAEPRRRCWKAYRRCSTDSDQPRTVVVDTAAGTSEHRRRSEKKYTEP